jgi:hypothetical protein
MASPGYHNCLMLDRAGRADSAGRIRKAMLACLNY